MTDWIPDAPPTLQNFLTPAPIPFPVLSLLAGILAVLYLAGAIRLWSQGRKWSVWRTVSFLLGCAALAAVMGLGIEAYGYGVFSVFMFQQLTLMMTIPPLLVLGSAGTLLLRATPHRGLGILVLRAAHAGLRSRIAKWILSPWLGLPLYLLSFYGLYLSDAADRILSQPWGHQSLEIGFFLSGVIFTVPVLSDDLMPVRLTYGGRALDVFAEAALHAFFGVLLMMSTSPMVDTFVSSTLALGVDPLKDQQVAGGIAWGYGEAPTLLMLLYIMNQWYRSDKAAEATSSRFADKDEDAELDAYNAYLEQLRDR